MHRIDHEDETRDQHVQEQYEDIPNDYAIITKFTCQNLYVFKHLLNEVGNYWLQT